MQGIYWAAVVVTVPVAGTVAMAWRAWHDRAALACFLIGLPLSAIVNQHVKSPALLWLGNRSLPGGAGGEPWWLLFLVLWLAPLTEEAIKLLPLAAPDIREGLHGPSAALRYGMASGVGFGLGEAWYLAWGISGIGAYASLPFYYFAGYMTGRLAITFAHGVMTSVAMSGMSAIGGGPASAAQGYMAAAGLHALLNLGPLLYQFGLASPTVANAGVLIILILLVAVFERMRSRLPVS